jgi:hypothetical protein
MRSSDQIKEGKMGGACSAHGEMRNACKVFVGRPEGKRPLKRPRFRWKDYIRMDLREVGWESRIHLVQDRD